MFSKEIMRIHNIQISYFGLPGPRWVRAPSRGADPTLKWQPKWLKKLEEKLSWIRGFNLWRMSEWVKQMMAVRDSFYTLDSNSKFSVVKSREKAPLFPAHAMSPWERWFPLGEEEKNLRLKKARGYVLLCSTYTSFLSAFYEKANCQSPFDILYKVKLSL